MHDPVLRMIGIQHHRIADIDFLCHRLHLERTGIGHHRAQRDVARVGRAPIAGAASPASPAGAVSAIVLGRCRSTAARLQATQMRMFSSPPPFLFLRRDFGVFQPGGALGERRAAGRIAVLLQDIGRRPHYNRPASANRDRTAAWCWRSRPAAHRRSGPGRWPFRQMRGL